MTTNPFMNRVEAEEAPVDEEPAIEADAVLGDQVETSGPKQPLAVRPDALAAAPVPLAVNASTSPLRVVAAHGGAGVTTLCELLGDALVSDSERTWPQAHPWVPESAHGRVLVTARSHRSGLLAAREILTAWHAGAYADGLELMGILILDDAPRLSKGQIAEIKSLTAMAPRGWHLPWQESLRMTAPSDAALSARAKWTLSRIRHHATQGGTHQNKESSK